MKPKDILPTLRPCEVLPIPDGDGDGFLLRDPQRLSDQTLTVTGAVLFCLQYFDGRTQVATLQESWRQATQGRELPVAHLVEIVAQLDGVYLLANERSNRRTAEVREEFRRLAVRPPQFGDDASEVRAALDKCYRAAGLPRPDDLPNEANDLAALVAPHIDYPRGGAAWALAYSQAKKRFAGDLVVILGTNHQFHQGVLAMTRKSYATPFGMVETAVQTVEEIAAGLPFDPFHDEFCHRDEHSIELSAIALRHAYGDRCPAIVPLLCGSLEEMILAGVDPARVEAVAAFHDVLRRIIRREGRRLLVLASVDLAHLGPQFGDSTPVTDADLRASLAADGRLLEKVEQNDAAGFRQAIATERNARHVCGVAPLFHLLSCVKGEKAFPFSLHHWRAEEGSAMVSFAAAGLRHPS